MALIFDRVNRIIEVEAPAIEVTIQQLIDTIRDWEDEQENMDIAQVAKASGKEELGGGLSVGITLELLDNWQLKFEDRPGPDFIQCTIKDGNLVGGVAGNPIKESAYTQVKLILSAAGTVAELGEVAQEASVQNLISVIGVPTSPTIANELDRIEAKTSKLPTDPADQSLVEARITTAAQALEAISQSIKNKTDGIPLDPAIQSLLEAYVTGKFDEIKGSPWTDETLRLIKKKIEDLELQPYPSRAHVRL